MASDLLLGIDVGSTTVKCVVVDAHSREILWHRYERHETRQAETVAAMLEAIESQFPTIASGAHSAHITGSGAGPLAKPIGARFVQEVNAVTLAVERLHPEVNSVIELGGQDAKIILFQENPATGERRVVTSMNDKCASGTGATIDKCVLKVGMSKQDLGSLRFDAGRLHRVAAKCGVFAETDIVNLIKAGVPAPEVMNSLADAIVMQNLSVLARGNTLRSKVLLLGGPNAYLPFLQDCWRRRIPETWSERGYQCDDGPAEELIIVPENAEYYAAYGAVVFGLEESGATEAYRGREALTRFIQHGRKANLARSAGPPLVSSPEELEEFRIRYRVPDFSPAVFKRGSTVRGYVGLDGGSTSTKAVLTDENGEVLIKEYQLSRGNPLQDTKEILARIKAFALRQGWELEILGFGATGYAADVLERALQADTNIVETVAHMMSARHCFGDDIDVICDIGGQDIKVLFMQNGQVKSFRLSNQCSAGNGMLLQAMADQFGVDIKDFADVAFNAQFSANFSYGCAVFLDTDRVNFQKEGYAREELFAGLAMVLPKNIWQYVVQIPRIGELGRKFVLQGGTQFNLAAVKAQVDYLKTRVPDAEVLIHPHCEVAGAAGAALEARRVVTRRGHSVFVGLDRAINLEYTTRTDETTRCTFCENKCSRSFIDTKIPGGETVRYIAGFSCEKGTVESKDQVVALNKERKRLKDAYPNLVDHESKLVFRRFQTDIQETKPDAERAGNGRGRIWFMPMRRKTVTRQGPPQIQGRRLEPAGARIGIPRVLNIYVVAPFLRGYLTALGVDPRNIVFSDETSEELWSEGGRFNSVDPCFPAKVSLAHVYNLLTRKQARKPLDYVWFPCLTHLPTFVSHTRNASSCPIVAGTPNVANAAFTKEQDFFRRAGVEYVDAALDLTDRELMDHQLFEAWGHRLKITEDENRRACSRGWAAMRAVEEELEREGMQVLARAERDNKVVLLMLGRPYHADPGLNHEVLEEFQALGYPVLSMRSIPKDITYLERFFREDLDQGRIEDVFDIRDVWPENYSANSAQKVWAAKFAARHPNVAAIDLSSFKCGHDAPTYAIIDKVLAYSKTPNLTLHDIDANKPGGSIKIRVKTYAYSLERYQEHLEDMAARQAELARSLADKARELVQLKAAASGAR